MKFINSDNLSDALSAFRAKCDAAYAAKSHGTHVSYGGNGSASTVSRSDHTHNYAGSSSAGGAATSANKVNTNLAIKLNGGTTEGTNLFTFNGSTAKTINITPSAIGAAASSHGTHLTLGTGSGNAFRGDYGNTAYTHSQAAHAPSNAQKNSDITKAEIEAKLTGTISSHTHAGNTIHYIPNSSFTTTAGNGSSGSYLSTKWSVANVNGITVPTDGMIISVRVPAAGVGTAGIVLSINGGANYYPIVRNVNSTVTTHYAVGTTINLIFNSTQTANAYLTSNTKTTVTGCWQIADYDSNTTYTNASLGQGYGTCATAEATVAKAVTLSNYSLQTGGVVSVKFTYAVPASATLNINSKGAKSVYFRGAAITAGVIKAGDVATFIYNGSQYHLVAIDRWQNDINATIKGLSVSGKTITYTKTDGTTGTITTQDTNTTYSQATSSALGLVKLYTSTGTNTDGTMTQNAINSALAGKSNNGHTHNIIERQDTRSVNETPAEVPVGLSMHLKSNGTDGLSDGGSYHPSLMMKPWNDKSGWPIGQIAVTQNNNLWFRISGTGDTPAWESWKKVSLDGHAHNYAGSSSAGGTANSVNGFTFWSGTQEQYDAIATKSETTIYMITE